MLATGAPFYGTVAGDASGVGSRALVALDAQMRETRYGFGRERRLRIVFLAGEAPPDLLREVARRDDAAVVGLGAVAGEEETREPGG